jgi:hypothetical protein
MHAQSSFHRQYAHAAQKYRMYCIKRSVSTCLHAGGDRDESNCWDRNNLALRRTGTQAWFSTSGSTDTQNVSVVNESYRNVTTIDLVGRPRVLYARSSNTGIADLSYSAADHLRTILGKEARAGILETPSSLRCYR